MGLRFVAPQLISKDTVLKLSGGVLSEIDPDITDCMLCVTATSLDSSHGQYEIYAEFEGVDVNFLQVVSHWLSESGAKEGGLKKLGHAFSGIDFLNFGSYGGKGLLKNGDLLGHGISLALEGVLLQRGA